MKKKNKNKKKLTLGSVIVIVLLLVAYFVIPGPEPETVPSVSLDAIPAYSGEPFVILNENVQRNFACILWLLLKLLCF